MHPRPAARTADEERVSVLHRQVVDRVRLVREQRLTRKKGLAGLHLCPMPRHPLNAQQWSRPADNACPDAQAPRFHPALPRNEERMLRGAGQRLHGTHFSIRQRDGDHGGGEPLDGGGDSLCAIRSGLGVTALYPVPRQNLRNRLRCPSQKVLLYFYCQPLLCQNQCLQDVIIRQL